MHIRFDSGRRGMSHDHDIQHDIQQRLDAIEAILTQAKTILEERRQALAKLVDALRHESGRHE